MFFRVDKIYWNLLKKNNDKHEIKRTYICGVLCLRWPWKLSERGKNAVFEKGSPYKSKVEGPQHCTGFWMYIQKPIHVNSVLLSYYIIT